MWIKTQDGVLLDARELYLTSAGGGGGSNKTEIHSDEIKCGSYKDHETAKTVLGMIEDFIVGGYETLFVMPDKDVTVFPMHDVSRPINLPLCGYYPRCEMIDVEAAAESIRRTEAAMKFVRDHRSTPASEAPIEKCCSNCIHLRNDFFCISCESGLSNWAPRGGK